MKKSETNFQLNNIQEIMNLISEANGVCSSWIDDSSKEKIIIDPLENKPIEGHYADTHYAAGLIILGKNQKNNQLFRQGEKLIESILHNWEKRIQEDDFHHDFNSFALCLAEQYLRDTNLDLCKKIRKNILKTSDSNHDTVNWLPLRAYVNLSRFEWTKNQKFNSKANKIFHKIKKAMNEDGSIEDRLPKGISYNLQYNIATVAALALLGQRWKDKKIDLDKNLNYLLNKILPDNDINYQGRGTNQIFAWGPWCFLLSFYSKENYLFSALEFLKNSYREAGLNKNIFLNDFHGDEKLFWWDYHYCSVYHSHFFLWMVLALNFNKAEITIDQNGSFLASDLKMNKTKIGGHVGFNGRSHYISEFGPTICALWLDNVGIIYKGSIGPWGEFGKKYSYPDLNLSSHFGLISQPKKSESNYGKLCRKIFPLLRSSEVASISPFFTNYSVQDLDNTLCLKFKKSNFVGFLNIPIFHSISEKLDFKVFVDNVPAKIVLTSKIKNQYGWLNLYRSRILKGSEWKLIISEKK